MRTLALTWVVATLTACPPPPLDTSGETPDPGVIRMLFPETNPGLTYCPDLTVYISVDDFELSEDIGGERIPGEGHWHLLREVQGCQEAVIAESSRSFVELVGAKQLPEGDHRLIVELVDNQHQPMEPPVRYEARVRVAADGDCVGG